jgi:hypothetical protein
LDIDPGLVDKATLWLFVAALDISVYLNFRRKGKQGLKA